MLIESFWNQVHLTKIFCVSDTVNLGRKTTHKTKLRTYSFFIGLSHPSVLRRVRKKVTARQRCIAKRGLCRGEKDVICLRR